MNTNKYSGLRSHIKDRQGVLKYGFGGDTMFGFINSTRKEQNTDPYEFIDPTKREQTTIIPESTTQPKIDWKTVEDHFSIPEIQTASTSIIDESKPKESKGPRGYRNNNPLNIRISNNPWSGKVADNTDGLFEQFIDMAHGYRAGFKNIKTHIDRGNNTLRKLISIWAPKEDNNNPESYANRVASAAGISVDDEINMNDPVLMQKIVAAMAKVENRQDANPDDITQGWKLYMGTTL